MDPPAIAPTERSLPRILSSEGARVEPPVRGEWVLRSFDNLLLRLDSLVARFLPEEINPLAQTGAIANTTLLVAVASGIVLLFWYSSSVHDAYSSVKAMDAAPFTAGLVRSVHRYSSDACMLFVVLHALKLFFARRFGGARWLAWITGTMLVGTLWFVGWLGYWLVWDERARQVALGTARMLDTLPIFADPLSRSFLSDDAVNSLLFFVVFFLHMLIPLAMGIALWLHITRLSRPKFLTDRKMTLWVVGTLLVLSVVLPADTAPAARMSHVPSLFAMDAWYLAPLVLTDRLGTGWLWALSLLTGVFVYAIPWTLAHGRAKPARVDPDRCNACEKCFRDCPYDAIRMVPRTGSLSFPTQAEVDPSKCVGCGICAGSCDSAGVGLPEFHAVLLRAKIDTWIDQALRVGPAPLFAFVCQESAGHALEIDEALAMCRDLPGFLVMRVPCAGWIHPLTIERALRHGAAGALVVACGPGDGMYREGGRWTRERLSGLRAPSLNLAKVDASKVRLLELSRVDSRRLLTEAADFRSGRVPTPRRIGVGRFGAVVVTVGVFAAATWAGSRVTYALPRDDSPLLIASFKHPGKSGDLCRDLTDDEKRKLPPHMRPPQVCERRRVPVRMRITVDGSVRSERAYAPRGIWSDGNSLAIERVRLSEGAHRVLIEIGDGLDPAAWEYRDERTLVFERLTNRVVRFDKVGAFQWR